MAAGDANGCCFHANHKVPVLLLLPVMAATYQVGKPQGGVAKLRCATMCHHVPPCAMDMGQLVALLFLRALSTLNQSTSEATGIPGEDQPCSETW